MPERSVLVPPLHTRLHVYLHTFILPAPAGSRPAAHARFGPGRRLGHPRCAASCPSSHPSLTAQRGRPPTLLSLIGPRGRPPTVSRHEVSTAQVVLPPVRLPIRHSPGRGVGRPQCHGTRCRLCRCAASGPSFYPSLTAPRGRPLTVSRHKVSTVQVCCLRPVLRSIAHRAAGSGCPQVFTTADAQRLACFAGFSLVSLPARQMSTSRRLGYQHPKRTVSKLCHRRFLKPVAGLFDFQPFAGLSCAAGSTGAFTFLFLSLLRPTCRPARASTQPVPPPAGCLTARRPGLRGKGCDRGDMTSPPSIPPGPQAQEPSCSERSA